MAQRSGRTLRAPALVFSLLLALLVGCGGDDPAGPTDNGGGTSDPVNLAWTISDALTAQGLTRAFSPGQPGLVYAIGSAGVVRKSTDDGETWSSLNAGTGTRLWGIDFLDAQNGILAGEGGVVVRTVDGGASFTSIGPGVGTRFWGAAMADASTFVVLGDGGTFHVTDDAGANWRAVSGIGTNWLAADFFDADHGMIVGAALPARTTDGGATWQAVAATPARAQAVRMLDADTVFVVGDGGMLARTDDGGATWTAIETGTTDPLRAIDFEGDFGIAAGGSSLLLTGDRGRTWTRQSVSPQEDISGAAVTRLDRAVAVGALGYVLRGTTGDPDDDTRPTVVVVEPADGTTGFGVSDDPYVAFSEPFDLSTIDGTTVLITGGTRAVEVQFDLRAAAFFVNPLQELEPATLYTLTVTTGVKDLAGNALAENFTSTFTTQSDEFGVVAIAPTDGATGVPTGTVVEITFDQPLNAVSIDASSARLLDGAGEPVFSAYAVDGAVLTIDPVDPLAPGTTYTVQLLETIAAVEGATLGTTFESTFTTGAALAVTSVSPVDGATEVEIERVIVVEFSAPVDPASVDENTFRVQPEGWIDTTFYERGAALAGTAVVDGNTITWTPQRGTLGEYLVDYTIVVGDVRSTSGAALVAEFTSNFRTVMFDFFHSYRIYNEDTKRLASLEVAGGVNAFMNTASTARGEWHFLRFGGRTSPTGEIIYFMANSQDGDGKYLDGGNGSAAARMENSSIDVTSRQFYFPRRNARSSPKLPGESGSVYNLRTIDQGTNQALKAVVNAAQDGYDVKMQTGSTNVAQIWFFQNVGRRFDK